MEFIQDLIKDGRAFARLVEEFGSQAKLMDETKRLGTAKDTNAPKMKLRDSEVQTALMQAEERNTGQVEAMVYKKYLKAAGGLSWAPFLILLLTFQQTAQGIAISHQDSILYTYLSFLVSNNLILGFWTAESIPGFRQGDYMALYAVLGVSQGIFSFGGSFAFRWAWNE